MKVVVSGATGLIGRVLVEQLTADGHTIIALSRSPERADLAGIDVRSWDPLAGPPSLDALEGADAVVHLAGEPIVAHRWSESQKKVIHDSRVLSTTNLVRGISIATSKPEVFVSGSAVGYYGDRGDEQLEENSAPGTGFLTDVCRDWEASAARASEFGVRVVMIRTGVVLSNKGGALQKMLPPFKLGVGGPLGSGRQWFPWIHISDIAGIFRHAIRTRQLKGPVNGVGPEPVTNAEFTRELARRLRKPAFLAVPEFALRALMGEMADVLFYSQRVLPAAALSTGYEFYYPILSKALENLL
ncbi:MAG TPA: TIGR01777 family oxidoreductase [Blastocatellia bacterium]|nr:TIGR01777 family oxidoreductase [Blastocatellia bacterium]